MVERVIVEGAMGVSGSLMIYELAAIYGRRVEEQILFCCIIYIYRVEILVNV